MRRYSDLITRGFRSLKPVNAHTAIDIRSTCDVMKVRSCDASRTDGAELGSILRRVFLRALCTLAPYTIPPLGILRDILAGSGAGIVWCAVLKPSTVGVPWCSALRQASIRFQHPVRSKPYNPSQHSLESLSSWNVFIAPLPCGVTGTVNGRT